MDEHETYGVDDPVYILTRILFRAQNTEPPIIESRDWTKVLFGGPYTSRVTLPSGVQYDITIARV